MTKRLDINDPDVWNSWRRLYYELTYEEQCEFANDAADKYPNQEHHDASNILMQLRDCTGPRTVLEFGGWKGELAKKAFKAAPIDLWTNVEICQRAIDQTVPMSGPYTILKPSRFDWWVEDEFSKLIERGTFNTFVSAHAIEHLSDAHLWGMLYSVKSIPFLILEAPISEGENDWTDYGGTHMLKAGWIEIKEFMRLLGYSYRQITPHLYVFRK